MKTQEFDRVLGIQLVSEGRYQSDRDHVVGIAPNWDTAMAYAAAYLECSEVVKVGSMGAAGYGDTAYLVAAKDCDNSRGYMAATDWSNCGRLKVERAWVIVPRESTPDVPELGSFKRERDGVYGIGPKIGPRDCQRNRFKITRGQDWKGRAEWTATDRRTGKVVGRYDTSTYRTRDQAQGACRSLLVHEAKQAALATAWMPAGHTHCW